MAYFGRGPNKIQNPICEREIYKRYVEDRSDKDVNLVDIKQFKELCDKFYDKMVEGMLGGKRFSMPFGLGWIDINKKKIKYYKTNPLSIDWEATVREGRQVWHLNEHSNGYNYGIDWGTNDYAPRIYRLYRFTPIRYMKRTLAKLIKNKEQDYYEKSYK